MSAAFKFLPLLFLTVFIAYRIIPLSAAPQAAAVDAVIGGNSPLWTLDNDAARFPGISARIIETVGCVVEEAPVRRVNCGKKAFALRLLLLVLSLITLEMYAARLSPGMNSIGLGVLAAVFFLLFPEKALAGPLLFLAAASVGILRGFDSKLPRIVLLTAAILAACFLWLPFRGIPLTPLLRESIGLGTPNFQEHKLLAAGAAISLFLAAKIGSVLAGRRYLLAGIFLLVFFTPYAQPLFAALAAVLAGTWAAQLTEKRNKDESPLRQLISWHVLSALLVLALCLLLRPPDAATEAADLARPIAELGFAFRNHGDELRLFHDVDAADGVLLSGEKAFVLKALIVPSSHQTASSIGKLYEDYDTLRFVKDGWQNVLAARRINAVFVRRTTSLASLLIDQKNWQIWAETPSLPYVERGSEKSSPWVLLVPRAGS